MTDQHHPSSPLIEAYRRRLHLEASAQSLPPTLETLQLLTELHLQHIPFENLSLHIAGEIEPAIVLSLDEIMHKVFTKGRGGCCLELNGLFSFLLDDLQFSAVSLVPCYVYAGKERGHRNKRASFRAVASHFMILVAIGANQYFVDVGLGEPALGPLGYSSDLLGVEQTTAEGMKSRIIPDPQGSWTDKNGKTRSCYILEWWVGDDEEEEERGYWESRLQWDERDAPLSTNCEHRSQYALQHFQYVIPILLSPKSSFYRKNITCLLTRTTKLSLSGRRLRCTFPRFGPSQSQSTQDLETDEAVLIVLKEQFGIELQANEHLDLSKATRMVDVRLWDHL